MASARFRLASESTYHVDARVHENSRVCGKPPPYALIGTIYNINALTHQLI